MGRESFCPRSEEAGASGVGVRSAVDLIAFLANKVYACLMFGVEGTSALTPALTPLSPNLEFRAFNR